MDQREALIAAVRAQVEKERQEKEEKLKKQKEAEILAGKGKAEAKVEDDKPKYKTLSAEELAEIEKKKRQKRAEELGVSLEELEGGLSGASSTGGGLGSTTSGGGLGSVPSGGLGSTSSEGGLGLNLDDKVKVVDGSTSKWESGGKVDVAKKTADDLDSILPEHKEGEANMYDLEDEANTSFDAQLGKLADETPIEAAPEENKEEATDNKKKENGVDRADEERRRIEAAREKAAAKKREEEEAHKKAENDAKVTPVQRRQGLLLPLDMWKMELSMPSKRSMHPR